MAGCLGVFKCEPGSWIYLFDIINVISGEDSTNAAIEKGDRYGMICGPCDHRRYDLADFWH